jgi:polyisoprenoid-binding protein YceI
MRSVRAALAAVVLSACAGSAFAADYVLDKGHATMVFTVDHAGFSKTTGVFRNFDAKLSIDTVRPDAAQLSVTVQTNSIDTFNTARDNDLKSANWFDAAHFPTMTFLATRIVRRGDIGADVTGDLTLKGVSRPVTLTVVLNRQGDNAAGRPSLGFTATGRIKRSDYGMTRMAGMVGDEIALTVNAEFGLNAAWANPPPAAPPPRRR